MDHEYKDNVAGKIKQEVAGVTFANTRHKAG